MTLAAVEVMGFGGGAPSGACMDLLPRHRNMKRNHGTQLYTISATNTVAPGGDVKVEISGAPFRGYMVQAVQGNKIIGSFKGTGLVTCNNRADTATHQSGNDKRTESFTWTAPRDLSDMFISEERCWSGTTMLTSICTPITSLSHEFG